MSENCPFCSAELPEKAVFCQMCGKKVINSKKCHHCGLENISSAARYCPACGIALTSGFNIKKTGQKTCLISDTPFLESELIMPDVIDGLLVNGVRDSAFAGNSSIKTVVVPSSIKEIGQGAFAGCSKLEKLVISDGVKEIKQGAFAGCDELRDITLGDSVEKIGAAVFRNCAGDAVITYKGKEYRHEDFWSWKDFLESLGCQF